MPRIYLSPSTQEFNPYVTGRGSEEGYMNLLADALVPYLLSNGIQYTRNTPQMTAASSIRQANQGEYDFYLALHSNASPEGQYGQNRGIVAYYYPGSSAGERAAEIFARNLKEIYPLPDRVFTQATTVIGEVRLSRFPAVLLEIGYHDNYEDAVWIETHIPQIAENLARSLTEYFYLPFILPTAPREGVVTTSYGNLNLREYPSQGAVVLAGIPSGARVRIYGEWQGWYVLHYEGLVGFAAARYVEIR